MSGLMYRIREYVLMIWDSALILFIVLSAVKMTIPVLYPGCFASPPVVTLGR